MCIIFCELCILLCHLFYSFAETTSVSDRHAWGARLLKSPPNFSSRKNNKIPKIQRPDLLSRSQNDESFIVTRTHQINKKAKDIATPITVFSSRGLQQTGQLNLADALARIDPSITVNALEMTLVL